MRSKRSGYGPGRFGVDSGAPVAAPIDSRTWLADLVEARLRGHDPVTARLRLPRELRASDPEGPDLEARARMMLARSLRRRPVEAEAPAEEALRSTMEGHLDLLTDLSLLLEEPPGAERLRAQLAAILAAAGGDLDAALKAAPGRDGKLPPA